MEGEEPKVEEVTQTGKPKEETPKPEVNTEKEVGALLAKIKELEDSYKGLQKTVNKKDEELKKQSDLRAELDSQKEILKVLAAELAERGQVSEDLETLPKEKKVNLLGKFDEIQKQQEQKRQLEEFKTKVNEYQGKVNQLGLDPNELDYIDIKDAVIAGKFDRADALIRKVEKSNMGENPKEKVETPKEMEERIRKKLMQEFNLTQTETGQPAGGSGGRFTLAQIRGMSTGEYAKNKEAIENQIRKEGTLK